jgi:outer membrane protein assembly factor BamB
MIALRADGTLKWSKGFSSVSSAPAIAPDGSIYVVSNERFTSLSPDGIVQWQSPHSEFVRAEPALGPDGTIYIGGRGAVTAWNPDRSERWTLADPTAYFLAPCVGPDGTIFVTGKSGPDAFVAALNPDEGTELWRVHRPVYDQVFSPSLAPDGTVFFSLLEKRPVAAPDGRIADYKLYALDASGAVKWIQEIDWTTQPPLSTRDGQVFTTAGRQLYVLRTDGQLPAKYRWIINCPPGADRRRNARNGS